MGARDMQPYSLYLVRCRDGTLYTGIATDVQRRISEHGGHGRGAKYLRGRGPLELVFECAVGDRSLASRVERLVKQLPRLQKERLVADPEQLARLLAGSVRSQ
ncbi:MAG: GIY-YIG nuclease family protein [Woeseia sp.]